jgi:uracil-DNA glycosylase
MDLIALVPDDWRDILVDELEKPYIGKLAQFLDQEMADNTVYPPRQDIFAALRHTAYAAVKVVILGQDPYHGVGQAHGLSFSVLPGTPLPPSLKNIFKELASDLGCKIPNNGYLRHWADQGALLLNAVLTVRAGTAASHKNKGWEKLTDAIIGKINQRAQPVVFVLWGDYAKAKRKLIDQNRHIIIEGIHPSPLSARAGFFGSRPFSAVNNGLKSLGQATIDWQIPDIN